VGFFLRCSHKDTTFPITRPRKTPQARRVKNTYLVCLSCGKELPYSWSEMRVVKERRRTGSSPSYRPKGYVVARGAAQRWMPRYSALDGESGWCEGTRRPQSRQRAYGPAESCQMALWWCHVEQIQLLSEDNVCSGSTRNRTHCMAAANI
jgi:hypothetical protein